MKFQLFMLLCFIGLFCFSQTEPSKKLKINITSDKDSISSESDLNIFVSIINETTSTQTIIIHKDKNYLCPLFEVVRIWDIDGNSILKYDVKNEGLIEEQRQHYTKHHNEDLYYELKTGEHLNMKYSLINLIKMESKSNFISKGKYEMQLGFCNNSSNILTFLVY